MIEIFQSKSLWVRIGMGLVIGVIGIMMLVTLMPGPVGSSGGSPDAVATVGGSDITANDVSKRLAQIERNGQRISKDMRGLYVRDTLDGLINERLLDYEAQRLGLQVTDQDLAEQIRQILPTVFSGGSISNMENYAAEVQQRTGLSVPEFEQMLHSALLQQKVRRLVTDGVGVTRTEIEAEFKRRNEKIKLEYVEIKPGELEAKVNVSQADLEAYFAKNKGRYPIPERRAFQYALLDQAALRAAMHPADAALEDYYKQNLDMYRVQNRVHVEHILLKTTGKTDAEALEIRKKAEEVLAKARKGANFEELAKEYSQDDTTKAKGGDLGWIQRGQTVPEFEQAAFALKKGEISDLVKTMFGFHIIKLMDREEARTKSFDEVRASIVPIIAAQMAQEQAAEITDRMAAAVRESSRTSIDAIAKKFNLQVGTVPPVAAADPLGPLGTSSELRDYVFSAQIGEDSTPIRVDRGTVVVSVTQIQPARPATLADVRAKVEADYRNEESTTLAKQRAEELYKRVQGGETLAAAAKALGFEVQTSEFLAQNDTLASLLPMHRLAAAFNLPIGQTSPPLDQASNWFVYKVAERQEPNPEDLAKQKADIERQLTLAKQQMAFDAFQESLRQQLSREGKLRINDQVVKRLSTAG
ncbi:MAG TPA: peptidyl-prolyl cis-trans isomerase [Candidatus Acidoferrales bacterium]|nr:peptidyl-prolyl cis-trans isomerase [Candidatus Acidoferrales bacterium]